MDSWFPNKIATVADHWDNALAESFFKTLKMEMMYQVNFDIRPQAKVAILEYIEPGYRAGWYNRTENTRRSDI
jgi:hypothetical protein